MAEHAPLTACFVGAAGVGVEVPSESQLRAYVVAARAVWPNLAVDDVDLIAHVATRSDLRTLPALEHAGDQLLACACLRGLGDALTAFEQTFASVISRVLASRKAAALGDDVAQTVRERLLLGRDGKAPLIASYRGTGPLRSWVAVTTATQLAMARRTVNRRREDHAEDDAELVTDMVQRDPELAYMKQRYRHEVEQSIIGALRGLSERERVLLRMQLGERLSIDQLGALYNVNRATAARWLASARAALVSAIRSQLRTRTNLDDRGCESVLRLVRSQLDISILRYLA